MPAANSIEQGWGIPRIFADTSRISEIERMVATGIIYGITTNPLIVAAEAGAVEVNEYYRDVVTKFKSFPVSIQLLDGELTEQFTNASEFAKLGDNVVVKVPMFSDGRALTLIERLVREGIEVNVTGLMNVQQLALALVAGRNAPSMGPAYLSLFKNRISDSGGNPGLEINTSRTLLDRCGSKSQIIVGSIRKGIDVVEAFTAGAHIATITPGVFWSMVSHPKSQEFIDQCQAKWEELTKSRT